MHFWHEAAEMVKAKSHDLLNKEIDWNNPSMLRQFARDLESETENLQNQAATQAGLVRTLTRQRDNLKAQEEAALANGKAGKLENNTAKMTTAAALLATIRPQLASKEQDLAAQIASSASLDMAVSKLKAKSQQVIAQVHTLESIDATSHAKANAAQAMAHAASILQTGADIDVDNIAEHIRSQADVNDVKFERAMGDLDAAAPSADPGQLSSIMSEF
jgi:phage shock protein A